MLYMYSIPAIGNDIKQKKQKGTAKSSPFRFS